MSRRPDQTRRTTRGSAMIRLRVGFVVIAMVLSVFGVRLVQLQGIDPQAYAAMARAEGMVEVELPAERGAILDRNGIELASSVDGLMIVGDPRMTRKDAPEIATYLAAELGVDYFETLERLRREGTRFQYLARRIPSTIARGVVEEMEARGYKGLSTRRDPMRTYPARDVAANVIGFIGEDEALAGLERTFDALLSGKDGRATYEVGGGNRIPLGESTTVEPQDGKDLHTTLVRDVQWYTQRVLAKTVRDARGDSGVAIVMDSRTGEIVALADYPTFDASAPLLSDKEDYGSRAAQDVYEPGSVQKVLTMASLIDAGEVTPQTQITVPEKLRIQGHTIHDHWDHPAIQLTLAGVLAKSSNIGTVLAAQQLEADTMHDYLEEFGLGQRTGIGVRGESAGQLPPSEAWSRIRQATIAFGQGVSVNALQMVAAINTIANDGVRVSPSIIRGSATTEDGVAVGTEHTTHERVVSAEAADRTMQMMELVTDAEVGVAPAAAIPGYRVAGKTGTAQRASGGRYDGTFTVSFAGFAPADDPRFTTYVVVHNPRNGGGGGSVAGPAFSKIMSYLLRRYAVPPTGTPPTTYATEW